MQLTNTTDYAIRIVCYLAIKKRRVTTAKLASELKIPESYIPKITKQLKKEKIISASEGISGGYALAKNPEKISLFDVISCMESTMAISRCLEKDGFCSRNYTDCCKVHQVLLDLQNIYNNRLENVKISDIIRPGKDEYFGRFYIILKVNLAENSYECIYSHNRGIYDDVKTAGTYDDFLKVYCEKYVCEKDCEKLQEFLKSDSLTEHLKKGCSEEDIVYQRRSEKNSETYVWMEVKRFVDENEKTAVITFHNAKVIPNTIVNMERELRQKAQDETKQYWKMVSLLAAVLNHNNLIETEHQDDICFYFKNTIKI